MFRRRRRAGREEDNNSDSELQGSEQIKLTLYAALSDTVKLFDREEDTYNGVQKILSAHIRHLESSDCYAAPRCNSFTNVFDLFSEPRDSEPPRQHSSSAPEPPSSGISDHEKRSRYDHQWRTRVRKFRQKHGITGADGRPSRSRSRPQEPLQNINPANAGEKVGPSAQHASRSAGCSSVATESGIVPSRKVVQRPSASAGKVQVGPVSRSGAGERVSGKTRGGSHARAASNVRDGSYVHGASNVRDGSYMRGGSWSHAGTEIKSSTDGNRVRRSPRQSVKERNENTTRKHEESQISAESPPVQKTVRFRHEFQPKQSRRQARKTEAGATSGKAAVQESSSLQLAEAAAGREGAKESTEYSRRIDDSNLSHTSPIPDEPAPLVGKRPLPNTSLDADPAPRKKLATEQRSAGDETSKYPENPRDGNKAKVPPKPGYNHSTIRTRAYSRDAQKAQDDSPKTAVEVLQQRSVKANERSQIISDVFGSDSPLKHGSGNVRTEEMESRRFPMWYMKKSRASAIDLGAFKNWKKTMLDNMNISYGLYSLDHPEGFRVCIDTRILDLLSGETSNQESWISKYDIKDVEGLNDPLSSDWFIVPFHNPDYAPAHWTLIAIQGLRASCEYLELLVSKGAVPKKGDMTNEDDFGVVLCMDSMGLELQERALKVIETLLMGLLHHWFKQNGVSLKRKHSIMIQHVVRQFTSRLCHALTPVQVGLKECGSHLIANAHYLIHNHVSLLQRVLGCDGYNAHVALRLEKGDIKMFKVHVEDLYETSYIEDVLENTHKKVSDMVNQFSQSR